MGGPEEWKRPDTRRPSPAAIHRALATTVNRPVSYSPRHIA